MMRWGLFYIVQTESFSFFKVSIYLSSKNLWQIFGVCTKAWPDRTNVLLSNDIIPYQHLLSGNAYLLIESGTCRKS